MPYAPQSTAGLILELGTVYGCTMTAGSNVITSSGLTPADVGRTVTVIGAGAATGDPYTAALLHTTVLSLVSGVYHLAVVATTSVTPNNNLTVYRPLNTQCDVLERSPIAYDKSLSTGKATLNFNVWSSDGSIQPSQGQPVWLHHTTLGDLFGGTVDVIDPRNEPGTVGVETAVQCIDWAGVLTRRLIGSYNSTYTAQTLAYVCDHLVYDHAGSEGFVVDTSGLVSGGPTINAASYDYSSDVAAGLTDACSKATTPGNAFYFSVDAWKIVKIVSETTNTAPFQCRDSDGSAQHNWLAQLRANTTGAKRANRCYATGKEYGTSTVQLFTGDGTTKTFSLPQNAGLVTDITVNMTTQTFVQKGAVDITGTPIVKQWYWTIDSPSIEQDAGQTPIAAKSLIFVTYKPALPVTAFYQYNAGVNAAAAVEGGTGYHDVFVQLSEVLPVGGVAAAAQTTAEEFADLPVSLEGDTYRPGLDVSQVITVENGPLKITATDYLIDSVSLKCADNLMLWTVHMVVGPLYGDWRNPFLNLIAGRGATGGGGGGSSTGTLLVAPGNVTIGTIAVAPALDEAGARSITIPYAPPMTGSPASIGTFQGVYVEIEAPDQSALASVSLDGTVTLAGGAGLTGAKQPYSFGPLAYSETGGTILVSIPEPLASLLPMGCRARLRSYSSAVTNDAAGSPTQTFTIPALPGVDTSATPWCDNPTFTNDAPVYSTDQGHAVITIRIYMTPPADVRFVGAVYSILNSEGGLIVQSSVAPDPIFDLTFPAPTWRQAACMLYACGSDGTHINPIIPLLTPSATVLIGTATPTATAISHAVATPVTQNTDGPNGEQNWQITQVSWTDAGAVSGGRPTSLFSTRPPIVPRPDPNAYQSWLTFQATDVSGTPAPIEQGGVEVMVSMAGYTGETHLTGNIQDYGYQPVGSTYTYAQLRIYVGNKTATGWDDPINSTLQTQCWAGAAFSRLNFGDAPAGVIPATRLDPLSLAIGLSKDPTTKKLKVNLTGPLYADISNNVNIRIASDFTVSGGPGTYTLSVAAIDLAKSVNFGSNPAGGPAFFVITGGLFCMNAVACNYLIAGDALFTGQATFAYSGGGKVTINSSGMGIADNNVTPNATVAVGATGITISKVTGTACTVTITSAGFEAIQGNFATYVSAAGVTISETSGAQISMTALGGIIISKGGSSVTITSSTVTIVNGVLTSPTITVTGGSFTINMDTSNGFKVSSTAIITTITNGTTVFGTPAGVAVQSVSTSALCTHEAGGMQALFGSGAAAFSLIVGFTSAQLTLRDTSGNNFTLGPNVAATATAGSIIAPSFVSGYLVVQVNGAFKKVPYYDN